jgi:RHS repeat-associated protein
MVALSNISDEHTSTNRRGFLFGRHYGNFYVFVSDVPFTSGNLNDTINQSGVWSQHYSSYPNPSTSVPVGRSGRYVRIQLGDTNYLSLGEVKVFASNSTEGISACGNPFLFTGREYDYETGLYYYRARYYNPEIGRFLQPDPVGYGNMFKYCLKNLNATTQEEASDEFCNNLISYTSSNVSYALINIPKGVLNAIKDAWEKEQAKAGSYVDNPIVIINRKDNLTGEITRSSYQVRTRQELFDAIFGNDPFIDPCSKIVYLRIIGHGTSESSGSLAVGNSELDVTGNGLPIDIRDPRNSSWFLSEEYINYCRNRGIDTTHYTFYNLVRDRFATDVRIDLDFCWSATLESNNTLGCALAQALPCSFIYGWTGKVFCIPKDPLDLLHTSWISWPFPFVSHHDLINTQIR